ncbi:DUF5050 domain-containing protein [Oceanirhabdus seepicola]|uniref:DUF5050 domain-containing protein n=1 Tax=Oceanirhabdus seepicola TaxID=2828781 RepID=A0A9J6P1K2_9CLOT|nr:DUF5050 domain-containing protein [Oceanirhabdus seepicola]MCM1990268.1 DUF5050 domain-containing protein [Oceanirhabdus seepicola]
MKKTYKYLIMCMSLIMCISFTYVDSYAAKEVYNTTNAGSVSMNKEWKIKFSREVEKLSLYSNIKIVDKYNRKVHIKIEVDKKDKKIVHVKPVKNYVQGKEYRLVISPNIEGKDGKKLKDGRIIKFTVKNLYAGLPYEDGLLIIGNTAYSIDYLANNSQMTNEILRGDNSIFYVYKRSTDKVKDILGDKFIDGKTKPADFDIKKPIEYIDADGNKTMYAWNKDKALFEAVNPSIDIKISVNLNSNADKVLVMNVEKSNWIDGAWDEDEDKWIDRSCFYKLDNSNIYYKIGEPAIFTSTDASEGITIFSSSMTKLGKGNINSYFEGKYNIKIKLFPKRGEGNSAGNIVNNGYVSADENGYIFYNNTGDDNRLYKYDTNGIFHNVISDDFAQYINVSDEWVYYSNYSDKAKLYRMKNDGSSKQKLNDDYSAFITIVGDYIYYSNYSDNGRISRLRKNGSDATTDNKGDKHGIPISNQVRDEAFFLNYVGDWIYYSNINDHYKVYAVNTSGTYRKKLSDEGASSIQVVDDWVYYTNNKGELRKVKTDGSKETQDLNSVVSKFDRGYFFNVVDDWIYYSNAKDSNRLYKIKTDGTENTRLTFEPVTYINIAYNTIYFVSKGDMYTVPIDTNGRIRPIAVKKVENDKKVVQVDDVTVIVPYDEVNDSIETIEANHLPPKVSGIMSDNRLQQFVVQWDKKNVVIRNGVRTYQGKLIGYNQYIELTMKIPSEMLNETTTIAIYNNPGTRNAQIEVYSEPEIGDEVSDPPKLREGDELKLYEDEDLTKLLRTVVVSRQGVENKAIFQNVELDRYGTKEYYLSIKRQGKSESKGTMFTVGEAPSITNSIHHPVKDKDDTGLGIDGRDFDIEVMRRTSNKNVTSSRIYLTTKGRQLRLQSDEIIPFDNKEITETSWQGTRFQTYKEDGTTKIEFDETTGRPKDYEDEKPMNLDSFGNLLMGTNYDLFFVSKYTDTALPDNTGSAPNIVGWASSEPASIQVVSEDLPYTPDIATEAKKYGDTITLKIAPKVGEIAYLIPVWEKKFGNSGYNEYIKSYGGTVNYEHERADGPWVYDIRPNSDEETWLDIAKTWLKQDGIWPFDEDGTWAYALEHGYITKLKGDGNKRIMPVPKGILYTPNEGVTSVKVKDNDKYYAPNLEYKLVIINGIGVSSVSNGTLTVDNRPPIIVEDYVRDDKIVLPAGEGFSFQSVYENADVYVSHYVDNLFTVQELEDAVAINNAFKFSIINGVTMPISTNGIKPVDLVIDVDSLTPDELKKKIADNKNAKISVVDQLGNIRDVKDILIYVDTSELRQIIKDAKTALGKNDTLDVVKDLINEQINKSNAILNRVDSIYRDEAVTQKEINKQVSEFSELLITLGIPHKHVVDPNLRIKLVENYLEIIRYNAYPSIEIDSSEIYQDLWLKKEIEYDDLITSDGDYNYKIKWEATDINYSPLDGSNGNIKTDGLDERAQVTRPKGNDLVVKLIGKIYEVDSTGIVQPGQKENGLVEKNIVIKGMSFITKPTSPSSDKAILRSKGIIINDATDIKVSIQDPNNATNYQQTLSYDGYEYSFNVVQIDANPNDIYYELTLKVIEEIGSPPHNNAVDREMGVKIEIDGLVLDNQIVIRMPASNPQNSVVQSY